MEDRVANATAIQKHLLDPFFKSAPPPRLQSPSQPQFPVIHNDGGDSSSTSPQKCLCLAPQGVADMSSTDDR